MDIIAKNAPEIDPENLRSSLQGFRNYMVETLELIDFTLSNQKNRISGAVSEENFRQLAAQVASLNSSVVNLTVLVSALSGLPQQVTALTGRMDAAERSITALESRMDAAEADIADLKTRVSALENPPT